MRSHGSTDERSKFSNSSITNKNLKKIRIESYLANPKLCMRCSNPILYGQRANEFCSRSCAATHSNSIRDPSFSIMEKKKNLSCIKCNDVQLVDLRRSGKNFICDGCKTIYPHSKVHPVSCKFCSSLFLSNKPILVCQGCQNLKWSNNKDQYSFKFNVFDYPDLFDLELLQLKGWVSFGGKRGKKKNLDGLSRDHRVSVSDAKKYGYDPYYISHPCNCDLIPQTENSSKHSKSSISYNELVELVNQYDSTLG